MTGNARIGAALIGGYLLGRTKKAKVAIGFGMLLAGKKLSLDPAQLGRMLADSPVLGSLNNQVRKELVEATKSAATSALSKRATGLADSLHERTRDLDDPDGRDTADRETDEDAVEDDGQAEDDGQEEERPPRRRNSGSASKSAGKSTARSGKASAGKASAGARSATSGRTRKAASGTRTTKSGGGRDE